MGIGDMIVTMVSPDNREVDFHWHPGVAGQMRLFYERKGWRVKPVPEPDPPHDPAPPDIVPDKPKKHRGLSSD